MNIDRRFAIVIGINDYTVRPLEYCVNDALAVAKVLEEKCAFRKEDIFTITSNNDNPIKDISGHLDSALKQIEKELRTQTDSVFFYFAGHGEYHFEQSALQFHDSFTEISDIFNRINILQPKYQCYVIDACESGGKVLTRGSGGDDLIEKYISKSSGILFMYAATENEKAKEFGRIMHGLFTYYFLDAVKNETLYDEDGILTPNRIQDFIARETSKESQFKQTPVIENRTIGYYPFAFKSKPMQLEKDKKIESSRSASDKQTVVDKEYFPVVPAKIRREISEELKSSFTDIFANLENDFKIKGYSITIGSDVSIFGSDIEDKLTDSIVERSRGEDVEAVKLLFTTERQENAPNALLGTMSIIEALTQKSSPKYTLYNRIKWGDERIIARSLYLKSEDIYKVSCGIVIIAYQAVFGVGLATSSFYLNFTGYGETDIKGPYTGIDAFKVHGETATNIKKSITSHLDYFKGMIEKWNKDRQNAISNFERKAK